jgi:aspartate aminotransferase
MYAYTGLLPEMTHDLAQDYGIFLPEDGSINVAGLNSGNVEYVAQAIHDVTKGHTKGSF